MTSPMRLSILTLAFVAVAAAAFATSPAQARDYPWCAQYGGARIGATNCGFVSFEQCLATIRGIGGSCSINPQYQGPPAVHPRRRYPY